MAVRLASSSVGLNAWRVRTSYWSRRIFTRAQTPASSCALIVPVFLFTTGAGALTIAFSVLVAIPIGLLQAVRRYGIVDYTLTGVSFVFYSMPVFWLALILISLFAIRLHWLPPQAPQGESLATQFHQWRALILPVLTLTLVIFAAFTRYHFPAFPGDGLRGRWRLGNVHQPHRYLTFNWPLPSHACRWNQNGRIGLDTTWLTELTPI